MKLETAFISTLCLGVLACASLGSAQSVGHDKMDARAARADIHRLMKERRIAKRHHDWGKVRQDNRLIAEDRKFIRRDIHKVRRAESY